MIEKRYFGICVVILLSIYGKSVPRIYAFFFNLVLMGFRLPTSARTATAEAAAAKATKATATA